MDRGRWTTTAVVIVGLIVALASLWLGFALVFIGVITGMGYHDSVPSPVEAAASLFWWTGLACIVAGGSALAGLWRRTPIPFLVAGTALAVAMAQVVRAHPDPQGPPVRLAVPVWLIPLGTASALLALVTAWLWHRPNAYLALATLITAVAAGAAIVHFTARSNAAREASERVCPHLSGYFEREWFEPSLTVPNGYLRPPRLQQSTTVDAYWFAVAELQGEGFEGDTDVVVWLIDAPGASDTWELGYHADRNRTYAANVVASSVSDLPDKPVAAHELAQLDACRAEVVREASRW